MVTLSQILLIIIIISVIIIIIISGEEIRHLAQAPSHAIQRNAQACSRGVDEKGKQGGFGFGEDCDNAIQNWYLLQLHFGEHAMRGTKTWETRRKESNCNNNKRGI